MWLVFALHVLTTDSRQCWWLERDEVNSIAIAAATYAHLQFIKTNSSSKAMLSPLASPVTPTRLRQSKDDLLRLVVAAPKLASTEPCNVLSCSIPFHPCDIALCPVLDGAADILHPAVLPCHDTQSVARPSRELFALWFCHRVALALILAALQSRQSCWICVLARNRNHHLLCPRTFPIVAPNRWRQSRPARSRVRLDP